MPAAIGSGEVTVEAPIAEENGGGRIEWRVNEITTSYVVCAAQHHGGSEVRQAKRLYRGIVVQEAEADSVVDTTRRDGLVVDGRFWCGLAMPDLKPHLESRLRLPDLDAALLRHEDCVVMLVENHISQAPIWIIAAA